MTSPDPVSRPRPRFKKRQEPAAASADPESLFGDLPRTPHGVGALWSHQADQLRTYSKKHQKSPDVALELPTGSGKTLVGLLIAEWRRRALRERVVYACPTKQLARQVLEKAKQQGIQPVLLIGSHWNWPRSDVARYTSGAAIAITTYSSIFNSNSHLGDAQTLLFDDAHAAEGYVAEAWSVSVKRDDPQYTALLDAFRPVVDSSFLNRMAADTAADSAEVRLLPIGAIASNLESIDDVLRTISDNRKYAFGMLQPNLASCLFYVARSGVYIRPLIPPTFAHDAFTGPTQRVYLSASLGDAGELERAFGRVPIDRVPVPPAWDRTGSGRRFFVFPELAEAPTDPKGMVVSPAPAATEPANSEQSAISDDSVTLEGVTAALLNLAKKRLILTPDDKSADEIANRLQVPQAERFTAKTDSGLAPFLKAESGTLLAPNRYDGMDLSAETCRLMLMAGLPIASLSAVM
ncbi:DEAD/DEAH box helicase (plasmid) [Rhodococcus pseudokoreensis]|uniref:DEAD/DEAH box helicase n=1 Tax=Rhodococcus pseudokoreensis TaxID=2811421 RepID=A0A974VYS8_9NOCA|nr:DEAD/DEAH box helicase [Rhodococcus pseudokoreensis]QSE87527.1 DEAD/DEAH box helicase [Rhodococcus pseudokoreensis]